MAAQTAIDFGLVIRTPMIEITTIGAGGGSIAEIDRGGLLQVGPRVGGLRSGAGLLRAGQRPADGDRRRPRARTHQCREPDRRQARASRRGCRARGDRQACRAAAAPRAIAAAEAIIRVANARMAGAIRLVSVERGHDPRHFALLPFGGGGALHAGAIMREVGIARALVPRYPGVTSALGCVISDMRHDSVQTLNLALAGLDVAVLDRHIGRHAAEGLAILRRANIALERTEVLTELDMSYAGQTHTVGVPLGQAFRGVGVATGLTEAVVRAAFERRYLEVYHRLLEAIPVRILSLRTAVIGHRAKFDLSCLAPTGGAALADCQLDERPVWIDGREHPTKIYDRLRLPVGAELRGPVILEQPDTTVFVDPGLTARVDRFGNLVLET